MRFVAGQGAGAQNHREANPAQVRQIAGRGAAAERLQRGGTAAERLCGRVPESAGNVSPWIAAAAKKPPVTALWGTRYWERTQGDVPPGNALCGADYSPALRRSAFSATWSWSITS